MGAPKKFRMLAALRPLRKSFSGADASRLAVEGSLARRRGAWGLTLSAGSGNVSILSLALTVLYWDRNRSGASITPLVFFCSRAALFRDYSILPILFGFGLAPRCFQPGAGASGYYRSTRDADQPASRRRSAF